MQHHGGPSRLLDFTYSIWVATYFALEDANSDCAVWAIDAKWTAKETAKIMRREGKPEPDKVSAETRLVEGDEQVLNVQFFKPNYVHAVCPLNPFRLNERSRIQKGVFLVPGDITISFMDNLHALQGNDHVIKVIIPKKLRLQALSHLFEMNISRTSLFPGLDGYAHSLGIYYPGIDQSWLA